MASPGFWDNQEQARGIIEEANDLKGWVEPWKTLSTRTRELREMGELLETESDEGLEEELGA